MKLIQPNCRIQFTAEDVEFIIATLGSSGSQTRSLTQLLADEGSRDAILDDEALFHAIIESAGCLRVSSHLYFYVLVRNVLVKAGIRDRAVADYVAEVLAEFSRSERLRCVLPGSGAALEYLFEMLGALRGADERTGFYIRTHIANFSLFVTGLFPERIRSREQLRGFPGLRYYESMGRANFQAASDHRLAGRYSLGPVLSALADQFQEARLALNDAAERLFFMGDMDLPGGAALLN